MPLVYAREPDLSVDDYVSVIDRSALAPKRPIADRARIAAMLAGSDLIVTVRMDGECVALARGISDGAWICYLADVVVREDFQGRGIGKALMRACMDAVGDGVSLTLLAMPEAKPFYDRIGPEIGMKPFPDAYYLTRRRGV